LNLLSDIESFIALHGLTVRQFENEACCSGLVRRLQKGSLPYAKTEERVLNFMDNFHNTTPSK